MVARNIVGDALVAKWSVERVRPKNNCRTCRALVVVDDGIHSVDNGIVVAVENSMDFAEGAASYGVVAAVDRGGRRRCPLEGPEPLPRYASPRSIAGAAADDEVTRAC